MKITYPERDYVIINEHNIDHYRGQYKKHLIKFAFYEPTKEKIGQVLNTYPDTNRFIVPNNIKIYNDVLRNTNKKYYVENRQGEGLITFFKRNNKCILNFNNLSPKEKRFALDYMLVDILYNLEAILISKEDLWDYENVIKLWEGNALLLTGEPKC